MGEIVTPTDPTDEPMKRRCKACGRSVHQSDLILPEFAHNFWFDDEYHLAACPEPPYGNHQVDES